MPFQFSNSVLKCKYNIIGWFYDLLDSHCEKHYRAWRHNLLHDVKGVVFEAGVGTGLNLPFYSRDVDLLCCDFSEIMLMKAKKRASRLSFRSVSFIKADVTCLFGVSSNHYDFVICTFLFCVMPKHLQLQALEELCRITKNGGRIRLLLIEYSKKPKVRFRQWLGAFFYGFLYGVKLDNNTVQLIQEIPMIKIIKDAYLLEDTFRALELQVSHD